MVGQRQLDNGQRRDGDAALGTWWVAPTTITMNGEN